MMMPSLTHVVLAIQQAVHQAGGLSWTSDEVRTWMLGLMTTMVGLALRILWQLRDSVRDMQREMPELKHLVELHEKEIRWLTGKRIAQEAIEQAERDHYQGPNRRHALRRDRDIVNDALSRSDEHHYPEDV